MNLLANIDEYQNMFSALKIIKKIEKYKEPFKAFSTHLLEKSQDDLYEISDCIIKYFFHKIEKEECEKRLGEETFLVLQSFLTNAGKLQEEFEDELPALFF